MVKLYNCNQCKMRSSLLYSLLLNFIPNILRNNIEYIKQKHCFLKSKEKTFTTIRVTILYKSCVHNE